MLNSFQYHYTEILFYSNTVLKMLIHGLDSAAELTQNTQKTQIYGKVKCDPNQCKIDPDLIFYVHFVFLSATSATCRQMTEMQCTCHTGNSFTTLLLTNVKNLIQSTASFTKTEKKYSFPYYPLLIPCSHNFVLVFIKVMMTFLFT